MQQKLNHIIKIFAHAVDNFQQENLFLFAIQLTNLDILGRDILFFIIDLNNALLFYLFSVYFIPFPLCIQIERLDIAIKMLEKINVETTLIFQN